jgi:hypothetical protein
VAVAPLRELPASVQPLPAAHLSSPKAQAGGEGRGRPEDTAPAVIPAAAAPAFAAAAPAPAFAAPAAPHAAGRGDAPPALSGAKLLAAKLAARAAAGVEQPAVAAASAAPGGRRLAKVGVWGAAKPAAAGMAAAAVSASVAPPAVAAPAAAVASAPANPFLAKRPAFLAAVAAPPLVLAPPPPAKRPRAAVAAAAAGSSSKSSGSDSGIEDGGAGARAVRARVGAAGLPPTSSQPAGGSQRRSGRFGAVVGTPQVALSGAVGARRTQLLAALRALDVRCSTAEKGEWEEGTTHVLIAGRLARGEKTLAALAVGAAIVLDTLADDSAAAGRWLGGDSGAEARYAVDGGEAIAAGAPAHWRSRAAAAGGAFAGISAAVLGRETAYGAASAASLRRILAAGGANVLVTTAQARAALRAGELQLVLLPTAADPAGREFLAAAAAAGGPAVALPGFLVDWLAAPSGPLDAHTLAWGGGGLQQRAAARGSVPE